MTKKTALRMETIHNKNTVVKDRALTAFKHYTSAFDQSNIQIANKIRHTWHVAENSERIAAALGCNAELAWLIGVLHDIGRFEQIRVVHGYDDSKGIDHGDYGESLLFGEGKIRAFIADDSDDEIIRKAVKYHNKYGLPDGLSNKELVYCNIIRDADKIDNFRGFHENDFYSFHERTPEEVQSSHISDGVVDFFMHHETIPFKVIQSAADFFLIPYALIFGIVYDESIQIADEQGYYRKMLDFEFTGNENREKFEFIKKEIKQYRGRVFKNHT